jgi:molybdate transport system permease protein
MSGEEWEFVRFTAWISALGTILMLPFGLAAAWWLAKAKSRGKTLVETFVTMPLVLPPVATGLVLLKLFGRRGPAGRWLHEVFGFDVIFTWRAVAIALAVMSLPLFVRAARAAFEEVNPLFEEMGRTLGAGEWRVFWTITLPLAKRGVLAGTMLGLARALGEFGATIMVAGNIPGETTTLSAAIYQYVQLGQDSRAWMLAGVSAVLAFAAVWGSELLVRERKR